MGKHSEWRKLAKKLRRKRIRQKLAIDRCELKQQEQLRREQSPSYVMWLEEQKKAEEFQEHEESRLALEREGAWLKAEEEAQRQWRELQKKLEYARAERAKQIERIKQEWELEQQKLLAAKEEKEKEALRKQKEQELINEQIENFVVSGGSVPEVLKTSFETNPCKPLCPFFQKTGACRFKDTCSRNHVRLGISRTILVPNFYSHYSLEQSSETEHGSDSSLEYENHETYKHYREFFHDIVPELEKYGHIKQLKVCCNHEPHLRGNVYIDFSNPQEAIKCFRALQGRWYGGKQLSVEFCNIQSWKSAVCGLHFKNRCPKGSACNFLHVFRNPGNMYQNAERESRRTSPQINYDRDATPDTRNWRWSESPERGPENGYSEERVKRKYKDRKSDKERRRRRSRSRDRSRSTSNRKRKRSRSKSSNSHRKYHYSRSDYRS